MNSISKNSAITFSSQIFSFVLGFISSIILARALGPQTLGIYTLIILIPTIMLQFGSLGIGTANIYFTGKKKYKIEDIVSNSLIAAICLGAILILAIWSISHLDIFQNFLKSNQVKPLYLWLIVFTVPFSLLSNFLLNIFLGREEIVKYNKINIFQTTFQLLAFSIFLLILKKGIFGAMISYVLIVIVPSLLVYFLITKITTIKFILNKKLFKKSISYGLRVYLGNLIQFLNYRLDMFLIAIFLIPLAIGYYGLAVGMAELLWMLPKAIATVLFPRISSLKEGEANTLTPKVSRHSFFILFIAALILSILAKPLVRLFYGNAFLPSVLPLLILLPGILTLGGTKTLSADLAGRGRPEIGAIAACASLVINIILNILLIPRWGIAGAAFASTIAYILAAFIVIIAFTKISGNKIKDVTLIKKSDFEFYKNFIILFKKRLFNLSK